MSFSENDNLELNEDMRESESTIFADPAHYNDEPRSKPKKSRFSPIVKVLAVVLCVGIAVGAYFAIDKLVPEPEEKEEDSIVIDVIKASSAYVREIKIKNENSEYRILPKTTQTDGESSTEWTLDGVDSTYTASSAIEDVADAVLDLDAVREIADTSGDFGFDDPSVVAEIVGDGESLQSYTVTIGDAAPADLGCYCKISGKDEVYIISSDIMLTLQADPIDFAVTTGYTGAEQNSKSSSCFVDGAISTFDYISISGAQYNKPLTIKPQTDESINAYFSYIITSPTKRIADDEQVAVLLSCFESGISSVGAYSYNTTVENLKKYRLDKPDFVVTISLNGQKNTFKFSKVDDLYCALLDGSTNMIHKIPISTLSISQNNVEDYYSSFIILETLSGLSQMKVKTPDGKQYSFDLKYTAADAENDIEQKYQAFYKGKELDIANFKRYYQKLIALTPISYENKTGLKTAATITLVHTGGTDDVVLTFRKYSSARYQVELDGIPMGLITATAFNELMADTPKVANGQTVNE